MQYAVGIIAAQNVIDVSVVVFLSYAYAAVFVYQNETTTIL